MNDPVNRHRKFWELIAADDALGNLAQDFLAQLQLEITTDTWENHRYYLRCFLLWCRDHNLDKPDQITPQLAQDYHNHLLTTLGPDSRQPLSANARRRRKCILAKFTDWLYQNRHIPSDPLAKIKSQARYFWELPASPDSLVALARKYFIAMELDGYAARTISDTHDHLRHFIEWCHDREITKPTQVAKTVIERYHTYLYRIASPKHHHPVSACTRKHRLSAIKLYFSWLARQQHILYSPAGSIELPRVPSRLPRHVLSVKEIKRILRQPDTSTDLGIRDRTIIETLYATAVRKSELANLTIDDLDLARSVLMVCRGKGGKDRYVPLTLPSIHWLDRYLHQVRPLLVTDPQQKHLFVTVSGNPIDQDWLGRIVLRYIRQAGITKPGSCHLFRHSVATLMLENGADVRYIQEFLGHRHLQTTQIYTKVSISKLKEIHNRTHPAKMHPSKTGEIIEELKQLSQDQQI